MFTLQLFFALLIGHAAIDFNQQEFVALYKSHKKKCPHVHETVWGWNLTGHTLPHAGAVWLITGNFALALTEFVAHTAIDYGKNEGYYNFHVDQLLHILCKLAYVLIIASGITAADPFFISHFQR
ncbi:MAG: DUF3307 domain-containing protein [Blastochloris viridis]|uniref:DUF3307 domain-containing protein n=1 Tax=Blastochloris viridis TaxID=1079 RepID=A0A6N4QYT0_BLAVI|nr:MAG: DUF3307 domain-containing protein [Blastochloris viridis]